MAMTLTLTPRTTLRDRDLHVLHAFDRAVHRNVRALVVALREASAHDRSTAEELRDWTDRTAAVIRHHHRALDQAIVPLLVSADPLAANLAGATRAGHQVVDDALVELEAALSGWVGLAALGAADPAERELEACRTAAHRLAVVVDDQVAREQATLEPAIVEAVDPAAFDEVRGELLVHAEPALLPFAFPWMVRGSTVEEAERLVHQLPRMLRTVHRFVWVPSHHRSYPAIAAAAAELERAVATAA